MAVCVGCGLEVNNGILEVNICGTPVTPNTTTGGLQCDPATENGCLKVVLNDSHAGCGLNAASGALNVDACDKGGILCGATDDDAEDECIYVNVQGQGSGVCRPLTESVNTDGFNGGATDSPNCNGLVRTCDGLWAPPKIKSFNFACGQISKCGGIMSDVVQSIGAQGALVSTPCDPIFPGHPGSADAAFGDQGNRVIIVNSGELDPCNPTNAMSWTAFNIVYEVKAGEVWRWLLHERICINDTANTIGGTCTNGWALQASQYIDNRGLSARIASVQINDNSTWGFGKGISPGKQFRMEAMITFSRLVGTGAVDNTLLVADFQYRNMGFSYHLGDVQGYHPPVGCESAFRDTAL